MPLSKPRPSCGRCDSNDVRVWGYEPCDDCYKLSGIDIEKELMAILKQEITTEIDLEILAKIKAVKHCYE